jgi:hypothetical protein
MENTGFKVLQWPLSPFIAPVVSQPWFTVTDKILKVGTAFDAVNAIGYFCSLVLMRRENPELKSTLPKWLSTVLAFGIPQSAQNWHQYRYTHSKKLSPKRITSSPVTHADVALICELDEQWGSTGVVGSVHCWHDNQR